LRHGTFALQLQMRVWLGYLSMHMHWVSQQCTE
jgi:hypothetical protein